MSREVHTIRSYDVSELDEVARQLLLWSNGQLIWLFEGNLGAGKTTLIGNLCRQLGVTSQVQSPTFSVINEYHTENSLPIYHFDLYRLKNEAEVLETGFEEYLDSGSYCFIEWPEVAQNLWPETYFHVRIVSDNEGGRTITSTSYDTSIA